MGLKCSGTHISAGILTKRRTQNANYVKLEYTIEISIEIVEQKESDKK